MSAGKSDASCPASQPASSSAASPNEGENRPRAVILMCLSAISFALMGAMVKLSGDLPLFEKVFVRNLVSLGVAVVMVRMAGARLLGHWHHQPMLMARSLIGLGGVMSFFYAIDHLLLADATILNKLSPFFVSLFAGLFLAERLGGWRLVGMLVAFSGAALVIKPQLAFAEGGVEALLPAMVGLGSAMLAGAAYTLIRAMRGREASATIVLHFSLVSSVVTLVPMLMNPVMPSGPQALALLGIGIFAAGGQILMTTAYRLAPAGEVSIYSYLTIVFSALAGWAIWGEVPDIASLIGFVLIAGVALIGWHASRVAGRVV
ncbi:DMT family transporter [Cobetia amphilecti]|uniref:DMT family transporter n=1 Tax=Cobetia amphilecti TaxID=1055104 RepID=UPI00329A2134